MFPPLRLVPLPPLLRLRKKVIVELNTSQPEEMEGMHDIYIPLDPPNRREIPIYSTGDRIGTTYIECGADRIDAIVVTDITDKFAHCRQLLKLNRLWLTTS